MARLRRRRPHRCVVFGHREHYINGYGPRPPNGWGVVARNWYCVRCGKHRHEVLYPNTRVAK